MDAKLENKLLKLLALAKRGIGGEKDNATHMLNNMLEANNLTLADITNSKEEKKSCYFDVETPIDRELLKQIVCSVINNYTFTSISYPKYRCKYGFRLTKWQKEEVAFLYGRYKRELKSGMENFFRAFINKNAIYPAIEYNSDNIELSDKQRADMFQISQLMNGIIKTSIYKAIGNSNETTR